MKIKQKHIYYIFVLLLCVFMITKILRGSADTESQGGIWNYIQVVFIFSGFYVMLRFGKMLLKNIPITIFAVFSLYMWFLALFSISNFSLSQIFNFITIPYGVMVLVLFYYIGHQTDILIYSKVFNVVFYLMAVIISVTVIRHINLMSPQESGLSDVYYVVSLLPLILVYTRRRFEFIPFLVTLMTLLLTGKRAGIIIIGVMLLIHYFNFSVKRVRSFFKNFFSIIILLTILYCWVII